MIVLITNNSPNFPDVQCHPLDLPSFDVLNTDGVEGGRHQQGQEERQSHTETEEEAAHEVPLYRL